MTISTVQVSEIAKTTSLLTDKAPYLVAVIVVVAMFLAYLLSERKHSDRRDEERERRSDGRHSEFFELQRESTKVAKETNLVLGEVSATNRLVVDMTTDVAEMLREQRKTGT
ncbi:MAG: hypothetical protein ACI82F_004532 [Planctomycetota bacterium]